MEKILTIIFLVLLYIGIGGACVVFIYSYPSDPAISNRDMFLLGFAISALIGTLGLRCLK